MARRRPMMGGMRGGGSGMPMRDGMMPRGGIFSVMFFLRAESLWPYTHNNNTFYLWRDVQSSKRHYTDVELKQKNN